MPRAVAASQKSLPLYILRYTSAMKNSLVSLPPLSLYVHLPWCVKKCPYCDFNSHAVSVGGKLPEADYLAALKRDFLADLPLAQGRPLTSIFFGGGTPSLLSAGFYQDFLDWLAGHISLSDTIEITLEANPGTVEQANFAGYRQAGINRLSIGAQSFNDKYLFALGRIHNGDESLKAFETARFVGFDNINLDIMYRLPTQSVEAACEDIQQAIDLKPEHISWYELTIEQNTYFYSHPPKQPNDDLLVDMEEAGRALLAQHGYQRYEISAYAQPNKTSKHNTNYWQFGDYLGIGAGAHGKITFLDGRILRQHKTRQPNAYMKAVDPIRDKRELLDEDIPLEFALNCLRLVEGVPEQYFVERTGLTLDSLDAITHPLQQKGLMQPSPQFACTDLGLRYLSNVLEAF